MNNINNTEELLGVTSEETLPDNVLKEHVSSDEALEAALLIGEAEHSIASMTTSYESLVASQEAMTNLVPSLGSTVEQEVNIAAYSIESLFYVATGAEAVIEESYETFVDGLNTLIHSLVTFLKKMEAQITKWVSGIGLLLAASEETRKEVLEDLSTIVRRVDRKKLLLPKTKMLLNFGLGGIKGDTFWEKFSKKVASLYNKVTRKTSVVSPVGSLKNLSEAKIYFNIKSGTKIDKAIKANVQMNIICTGPAKYMIVTVGNFDAILRGNSNYMNALLGAVGKMVSVGSTKKEHGSRNFEVYYSDDSLSSVVDLYYVNDYKAIQSLEKEFSKRKDSNTIENQWVAGFDILLVLNELSTPKENRYELLRQLHFSISTIDKEYEKSIVTIMNTVATDATEDVDHDVKHNQVTRKAAKSSSKTITTTVSSSREEVVTTKKRKDWKWEDFSEWSNSEYATLSHRKLVKTIRSTVYNKITLVNTALISNITNYRAAISLGKQIVAANSGELNKEANK